MEDETIIGFVIGGRRSTESGAENLVHWVEVSIGSRYNLWLNSHVSVEERDAAEGEALDFVFAHEDRNAALRLFLIAKGAWRTRQEMPG